VLGRLGDARAMLEGLEALRRTKYVDAYHMAVFRSALGQPREALAELERAYAENSSLLYAMDVYPHLHGLRSNPAFRRLRRCRGR